MSPTKERREHLGNRRPPGGRTSPGRGQSRAARCSAVPARARSRAASRGIESRG